MLDAFYALPSVLALAVGVVLTGLGGLLVAELNIRFPSKGLKAMYRDLLPPLCAAVVVSFAVFAVLVANTTWNDQEEAFSATHAESFAVQRLLALLPKEGKGRALLKEYVTAAIADEWPAMERGEGHANATAALIALQDWVLAPDVPLAGPEVGRVMQGALESLVKVREKRLMLASHDIPSLLWGALLISALIVLQAVAMAHAHAPGAARLLCGLYGMLIGTILVTALLLDHPYAGASPITAQHLVALLPLF